MGGSMSDNHLDLSSEPGPVNPTNSETPGRKFLGVQFACCGIYARIYLNRDGTAYHGHCPRCAKPVTIKVGKGGTSDRFFTAY